MIEISNVTKLYGSDESATAALKGVSLTIDDGAFTARS